MSSIGPTIQAAVLGPSPPWGNIVDRPDQIARDKLRPATRADIIHRFLGSPDCEIRGKAGTLLGAVGLRTRCMGTIPRSDS